MKVVLHLFIKDVTRLRAPLLVWAMLFVLQLASLGWWPGAGTDPRLQLIIVILRNLVPLLQMLMLLVIVPLLVHEDPVIGSTAFWLTRPISGRLLLGSKAFFAVLFLIITPLTVDLAGLVARGDSGTEFVLAGSAIALGRIKFLVLVFTLAALTQTFSRFALTGVVLVVSYVTAGLLALVVGLYATRESGVARMAFMGGSGTLADLTTIGFGAAVIINQYLTRKTVRSWLLLATGMIVVFALGKFRVEDKTQSPVTPKTLSTTAGSNPRTSLRCGSNVGWVERERYPSSPHGGYRRSAPPPTLQSLLARRFMGLGTSRAHCGREVSHAESGHTPYGFTNYRSQISASPI